MAEFNIQPAPGEAPKLSKNALTVLQSRYLIKDHHGKCIETPAQLFSRVASLVAEAEVKYGAGSGEVKEWHRKFYDFMASLRFLPNSPALMNANRPGGMLSACFVLPIEDSIEAIFETIKQTALIQKAGGGTGFSFDKLRPTGDRVAFSGGTTSGPISFWRVFSETTDAIQQGAFRRGANMGMMSVGHPDILKFLYAKQNLKAFTNFNVSVKITDDWMRTLAKSSGTLHIVKNPRTGQRYLHKTNMDWAKLAQAVKLAVRFLDNIIDVCNYPVRNTVRLAQANRKIGLGVMGFADCLFALGIPYDSQQGVEFGATLMRFISKNAHQASSELANLRGPFPNWNQSTWRTEKNKKVRNASITCVAPTGTISIIADCSCGIEPDYSLVFVRQILDGSKMLQINPIFKQIAQKGGFYSKKLEKQIVKTGSIQKNPQIPAKIRRVFKCAYDIKPQWHIRMQAAFQQHCDAAVSKTINFGEKATVAAVDKAYKLAYRLGCKGITIYRRHSRDREPMSLD